MIQLSFWKREHPLAVARRRLREHMASTEVSFLACVDRQVQARNRALLWGDADMALVCDKSLRELMQSYDDWKNGSWMRSVMEAMLPPEPEPAPAQAAHKYVADSLFLRDCYHFLTQQGLGDHQGTFTSEPEWACGVTGPRLGEVRLLDRLVPVKISYQSAGGIRLSNVGLQEALIGLQRDGHVLNAVFHSHRMHGPGGARPSQIDMDTQEHILEAAYPAIQAIFTEDGYIRFFSFKRPFEIAVYGKGVENVEPTLFKLQRIGVAEATLWGRPLPYGG